MKVIDPGRRYELAAGNSLAFLHKEGGRTIRDGTTNEELLEVLIDRVTESYQSLPCEESIRALYLLREALATFLARTARRINAQVEGTYQSHEHIFESIDISYSDFLATEVEQINYEPN